jgi:hypothetical protein
MLARRAQRDSKHVHASAGMAPSAGDYSGRVSERRRMCRADRTRTLRNAAWWGSLRSSQPAIREW